MSERTFSKETRDSLAKQGKALSDGSYPIPDKGALRRAIQSIGRAGPKGSDAYNKVKALCIKRAKELDAMDMIPEEWMQEMKMDDIDISIQDFLEHFGVKGMHWGVRNTDAPGVSKATNKEARKDAEEFARAKLFFGEGAGNRRKLIKASVEAKSKKDPAYAKAFDHHLARQDMSTHSEKARAERKSIDRKTRNKQRGGAIARRLTGEMGTQAALVGVVALGVAYAKSPKAQTFMKKRVSDVKKLIMKKQTQTKLTDFFKNNGFG